MKSNSDHQSRVLDRPRFDGQDLPQPATIWFAGDITALVAAVDVAILTLRGEWGEDSETAAVLEREINKLRPRAKGKSSWR